MRGGEIRSRERITNRAIIDAIVEGGPSSVIDIGCGEGWLVRELATRGIDALGIDASAELVDAARLAGGRFEVVAYDAIDPDALGGPFDAAVCNFSLIGKTSTEHAVRTAPALLGAGGRFIVQTLHPIRACGDLPYRDGWREGSWVGFGESFVDPAPWYFRTIETWESLFAANGLTVISRREPADPDTGDIASVVFVARRA